MKDSDFMARALELALNGNGYTSPNPLVGAVVVKNNRIIGEGHHPQFGKQHAEVMAIENASESVEGAEIYCNLEPCTNSIPLKKTPPCAQRLIREKIRKVYISTIDPNPYVNGRGVKDLRSAGIEVEIGQLSEQALELNEPYFKFIQAGFPFVHLKLAMSLDGRIATSANDSKWITNEAARKIVHQMRRHYDAVLVGANTLKTDNPRLTVRLERGRQPYRLILSSKLDLPCDSYVFNDQYREKTIIFTTPYCNRRNKDAFEERGVRIKIIEADENGQVNIKGMLQELGKMKICSLLVEGGGCIFTEFLRAGVFDKISIFTTPIIIGQGKEAVGNLGISKISHALRLHKVSYRQIDSQILIQGYRNLQATYGNLTEKVACLQE